MTANAVSRAIAAAIAAQTEVTYEWDVMSITLTAEPTLNVARITNAAISASLSDAQVLRLDDLARRTAPVNAAEQLDGSERIDAAANLFFMVAQGLGFDLSEYETMRSAQDEMVDIFMNEVRTARQSMRT